MIPVQPTEFPALEFGANSESKKIKASSKKIGWIHSVADKPGAKFDVVIKDGLGRLKYQGTIKGDTEKSGSFVNLETHLGEELDVSIVGLEGAEKIQLFIN